MVCHKKWAAASPSVLGAATNNKNEDLSLMFVGLDQQQWRREYDATIKYKNPRLCLIIVSYEIIFISGLRS